MTNLEAKKIIYNQWQAFLDDNIDYAGISEAYKMAMKALEQQPFINKPCVSEGVCREDKIQVLDKIRAEIEQLKLHKAEFLTSDNKVCIDSQEVLKIIDKYREEREADDE